MRVGVWLIGALGDVATTTVVGARAIARGLAPRTGLVSETALCEGLELAPFDALVFGGHDVREGSPLVAAERLADEGVIPYALPAALREDLEAYAARIRPGCALGGGRVVQESESQAARGVRAAGP
ncbi:MAG: myo-inositol-1-phosphate synthase, partial [Planctomycetes bacterium]|nr:myo-inositol-1-phosphate synthase [Planctomycetota bacterium]